jgi:23S rRNA pseudouridine1911/1915/1917 synthase
MEALQKEEKNKLQIIFENSEFAIINKSSGLTVNRSDTTLNEKTLQDLIEEFINLDFRGDEEFISRSGIVHRLDKETSGILIVAKNPDSFKALQLQFKGRVVEKEYIALCHGEIIPAKGMVNVPVGRLPWNRKRFGVLSGGREAQTAYEVHEIYKFKEGHEKLSLVRTFPKTGRTHQIRVHMKYLGHPIFGDELYAGRKVARDDRRFLQRVFLHAEKISFIDPQKNVRVVFKADLPGELVELLENLTKT